MELQQYFEMQLEEARQAIPGGSAGWRPERLILRDWWHWRDQEFGFAHGRLALTGQNAGGKSSLLALTIPMLLDGRTDPVRLDPAQSRDRFLHYYLLGADDAEAGNPEAFRYEARTGYIALEFFHHAEKRFLTIGMGISASRTSPRRVTDWWGFLLLKGQRLGRDFEVRGADSTCLGRREFARLLGDGGLVMTERAEYARQVNNHLFGLEPDDFQALIEMLLQARRPKLGEQSGPDKVCDLLRRALPGVPADRLGRVGEVVNNIEEYRANMADVTAKAGAVGRIDGALLALAEVLVQESAQQYLSVSGALGNVSGRLKAARESLEGAHQELEALERAAQARERDRAALQAEADELRQGAGADLKDRLTEARAKVASARGRLAGLDQRVQAAAQAVAAAEREQQEAGNRFGEKRRAMAAHLERLAREAEELVWRQAGEELREAARAVAVLAVADPLEVIEGAGPDLSLEGDALQLKSEFRSAADARRRLDEAEEAFSRVQAEIDGLRRAAAQLADDLEAAKDRADDRAETLVAGLLQWQEQSPVLEPGDLDVTRVAARLRGWAEEHPASVRELTEPLGHLAERRRRALQEVLAAAEEQERMTRVRVARLEERLAEAQADQGDPPRSEVRSKARAELEERLKPLFRLVRFRQGVDAQKAALVEAAILEAGWLDLLISAQAASAPGTDEPGGDAWLTPEPLPGPTLEMVLEPEPDAPPAVAAALASIGWGEGSGPRWVAADGRWQNGPASGRVVPWAEEEPGYIGEANRVRRRERRTARAQAALDEAVAELRRVEAEREAAAGAIDRLTAEMAELEQLPWQPFFDALSEIRSLEGQLSRAREQLEREKPRLAQAEAALNGAAREFDRAAEGVPGASGLSYEGLLQREMRFALLAQQLNSLAQPSGELADLARTYRSRAGAISRNREALAHLEQDREQAGRELAAGEAAVRTLEGQLGDPDVQAQQRRLEQVVDRLQRLAQAEEGARTQKADCEVRRRTAQQQIQELEPQEQELRKSLAQRLDRVRSCLALHVALAPHLEALEKEGPVAVMRRLPRPAEDEEIEPLIRQRQMELSQVVYAEQDLLRDYRPTWSAEGDSLTFIEDRIPLPAHQLRERLELRAREYADLMEEEQRKLFEDIIYEGILDELRRLIRQAREFTRRTNDKLKALRISNGEQLSLRLSPLPPEQMPGARIALELEQMEQGSRWLDEGKREVLLSTIKAEVERVREAARASGEEIGYHDAVIRALDYRNWYEYQLLSKMPGQSAPAPIRTRGFGRRSTSAKAWALAVPVLAAVAARYDASPRPDVPRLIGLDEAFAGLDSNNQENYLGFLTQLDFCWIITAPDELPYSHALSAAMTYRMSLEGSFHTAFPILWNGQVAWEPMAEWVRDAATGREQ